MAVRGHLQTFREPNRMSALPSIVFDKASPEAHVTNRRNNAPVNKNSLDATVRFPARHQQRFTWQCIVSQNTLRQRRFWDSASLHERAVRSCPVKSAALVEDASRVDDDGLAGHGLRAAHGDHHVGAVVLVGWPLQERA